MPSAVEVFDDPVTGSMIVTDHSVPRQAMMDQLRVQGQGLDPEMAPVVDVLNRWASDQTPMNGRRLGGVLDRDRYVAPDGTFKKIELAREALRDDDVLGNAADITEAYALSAVSIFSKDLDEQDALNQWAGQINMDDLLRKLWRITISDSQWVATTWWDRQSFKLRGETPTGKATKKTVDLVAPVAVSTIDTTRVVPVGMMLFGQEQLAYIATGEEAERFDVILGRRDGRPMPGMRADLPEMLGSTLSMTSESSPYGFDPVDPIVRRLFQRRYKPDVTERRRLAKHGISANNLFLLDPRFTFRHTLTKPDHELFADPRMASLFPILDLKHQLRQMDRAFLVGGTNYIILITKGTDGDKASNRELANLKANAHKIGQFPLLTGDHRLNVQIITPKIDMTLAPEKWRVLDERLYAKAFGTFTATGGGEDSDPLKLGRVIGTGLESRRRMQRRTLEARLFKLIFNANPQLAKPFKMVFSPDKISLAFDQAWATFIQYLLDGNNISRETALSQFGLDQSDEADRKEREKDLYDDTFKSFVPYSGQAPQDPGAERQLEVGAGRTQGGNRNGGGAAPGTGQGQETTDPARSETGPRRRPRASDVVDDLVGLDADTLRGILEGDVNHDPMLRDDLKELAGHYGVPGRHQMKVAQLIDHIIDAHQEATDG